MNTDQYLDTFYANIATSKDKTFDFVDGKSIKYRTVVNGTSNVLFPSDDAAISTCGEEIHQPKIVCSLLGKIDCCFGFNRAI